MKIFGFGGSKFSSSEYIKTIQDCIKRKWDGEAIELEVLIYEQRKDDSEDGSGADKRNILVFVDKSLNVDWIVKPNGSKESNVLTSRAMLLEALPHRHFPRSEIVEFKKIVGHAVLAGINEDEKELCAIEKMAIEFHGKRTVECSRKWTILISLPIVMALFVYVLCHGVFEAGVIPVYLAAALSGVFGAFLSLMQRVASQSIDSSSGVFLHFLEVIAKLSVGALSGFMAAYIGKTILLPEVIDILLKNTNGFVAFSFVVGFSERLIPRIVSTYERKVDGE